MQELILTLVHYFGIVSNKFMVGLLRYGNPDCQLLETLKIKIQINKFLTSLSNNLGSDFIFRVAICYQIAKTA